MDRQVLGILAPELEKSIGWNQAQYGYIITAFQASYAIFLLLSGGLGYRNKGMFIDLTYVQGFAKDVNFPYRLADKANTFASIKETSGTLLLTVGFKFF